MAATLGNNKMIPNDHVRELSECADHADGETPQRMSYVIKNEEWVLNNTDWKVDFKATLLCFRLQIWW